MARAVVLALALAAGQLTGPSPKTMFYNPGGVETIAPPRLLPASGRQLREVNYVQPVRHCGIHYWFEDPDRRALTVSAARAGVGPYSLHVRASCNGFLAVWDVTGTGRELTPRTDARWSGFQLGDGVFTVPGAFRFSAGAQPPRIVIVWARSQTEVAGSADDARQRLVDMPQWWPIATETEEAAAGEVGTYVVNGRDAGVAAEIVFRKAPVTAGGRLQRAVASP